jgi:hypothetical protein
MVVAYTGFMVSKASVINKLAEKRISLPLLGTHPAVQSPSSHDSVMLHSRSVQRTHNTVKLPTQSQ